MSAVSSLYHIVINTHGRKMTLPDSITENLYRYITGVARNKKSTIMAINGIENHVHMLVELSPTIALSDLVRDIKQASSKWLKGQPECTMFDGWGKEYGAFSCSSRDTEMIKKYIANQRVHHRTNSFENEYQRMVLLSGNEWNEYRLT
ncbi:MAG: IS200/IS605 family transposase [Muribaculaceae bacterium]|nr:IS200/IS605 family transposase [Muribaculaceae bacterium]